MFTLDNYPFAGKRAIVRVDFNVPLNAAYEITDDTRIRAAIPTIERIIEAGGSVILMSHLGRPKQGPEEKFSLIHLIPHLSNLLNRKVDFANDCIGEEAKEKAKHLQAGDVLLLENLRFYKGEEKGDTGFAKALAGLADVYVNDAFGTAHRAHASTTIIADFFPNDKLFGYVIEGELSSIDKVMNDASGVFTAILGGSKVSSKITIIENLMDKANHMIIGGGMMFTFIKALGGQIGSSLVEEDKLDLALELIEKAKIKGVELHFPTDAMVAREFSNDSEKMIVAANQVPNGWMGLDIGPESATQFASLIESSNTILWNGPMGVFEFSSFNQGTRSIADSLVKATQQGAFSLIGGGDSVAAINQYGLADKVSYVSTGGGALLEYIEGKELPGIKAIRS